MQCMSCSVDIPPTFIKAIQSNTCPSCGDKIMNDEAQILMTELQEAMTKMPNNPQGLAGWLMSNYHMQKFGTAEPAEFYSKNERPQRPGGKRPVRIGRETIEDLAAAKGIKIIRPKKARQHSEDDLLAQINSDGELVDNSYEDQVTSEETHDSDDMAYFERIAGGANPEITQEDLEVAEMMAERAMPNQTRAMRQVNEDRLKKLELQNSFSESGRSGGIIRADR